MNRRQLLILPLAASAAPAPLRLIAHRGGIVDSSHPENSRASIQAAIERGYWMIEVDVRVTKDGEPILQHDPTFERFYNVNRKVEELTWAEAKAMKVIHFEEACAMCRGKMQLMLDIKNANLPDRFYEGLAKTMDQAKLLKGTYLLGGDRMAKYFVPGGALRSVNRTLLGTQNPKECFLFELASELDQATFEVCRKSGIDAVAAVNTFRYTMAKRDEWKGPQEDIAKLRKIGVNTYQIDSMYEPLFKAI